MKIKNKGLFLIAITLIAIIMISSSFGLWAWAKYTSSQSGFATAEIAQWSFELKLKEGTQNATETSGSINLASTQFSHVKSDTIAPGTSGLFYVIVDTTGTEVDTLYTVDFALTNCPRNIKFYHGTGPSSEKLISESGVNSTTRSFSIENYLEAKKDDNETIINENGKHYEPIYWQWDYNGDSANYDQWDTTDSHLGITTLTITATATEMLAKPQSAQPVSLDIGDTVPYTTSLNNVTLDSWKVFHKETINNEEYVYLILADVLPNSAVNIANVSKDGTYQVYVPFDGQNYTSTLINAMTNQDNWNTLLTGSINGTQISYSSSNDSNIKAMGSPTIELFQASWNSRHSQNMLYVTLDTSWGLDNHTIGTTPAAGADNVYFQDIDDNLYYTSNGPYWLASLGDKYNDENAYAAGGSSARNNYWRRPILYS